MGMRTQAIPLEENRSSLTQTPTTNAYDILLFRHYYLLFCNNFFTLFSTFYK